jgi:peptidoglycan/LPS O-acetylase OafA/YrhL
MEANNQPSTLSGIQALRALACLLVIFQHATFFACAVKGIDYHEYLRVNFGWTGVGLFFVISGFVMGECFSQGKRFIINRAARIYPPYWIAIGLSALLIGGAGTGWSLDARSIALIPSTKLNNSYQIPYWTLCYEVAFYCITYLMILGRLGRNAVSVLCLFWLVAIWGFDTYYPLLNARLATGWFSIVEPGRWILFSPMSAYFVFGLLLSAVGLTALRAVPTAFLGLAAICVWWLGSAITLATYAQTAVVLAFSYSMALAAITRIRFPVAVTKMGDYSYGAYLFHFMAIVASQHALAPVAATMRLSAVWIVLLTAGAGGGLIYGWCEHQLHTRAVKPLLRLAQRSTGSIKAKAQ